MDSSSRTKRLSAMIDSLQTEYKDDELLFAKPSIDNMEFNMTPTTSYSPPVYRSEGSPLQGSSSISTYSGVIDDAVEVIRVRNNTAQILDSMKFHETISNLALNQHLQHETDENISEDAQPELPDFPTVEALRKTSYAKKIPNFVQLKTEDDSNDTSIPTKKNAPDHANSISVKSLDELSVVTPSRLNSKIMKNHTASSSLTIKSINEEYMDHTQNELASLAIHDEEIIEISDTDSIVSSITPQLQTIMNEISDDTLPLDSVINNVNPTIPPRSKARPRANPLEEEEEEEEVAEDCSDKDDLIIASKTYSLKPPEIHGRASSVSLQNSTNNSDSYYSAASFLPEQQAHVDNIREDYEHGYISKPLPILPLSPRVQLSKTANIYKNIPKINTPLKNRFSQNLEDEYEDIPMSVNSINKRHPSNVIQAKPKSSRNGKSPKTKSSRKSKQHEIRSFDIGTITELLNATKGTLVGSEFANLGMQIEEKKVLERLVDSLSRLTADMILDPQRFDEGIRRLNKATKALDGFTSI